LIPFDRGIRYVTEMTYIILYQMQFQISLKSFGYNADE